MSTVVTRLGGVRHNVVIGQSICAWLDPTFNLMSTSVRGQHEHWKLAGTSAICRPSWQGIVSRSSGWGPSNVVPARCIPWCVANSPLSRTPLPTMTPHLSCIFVQICNPKMMVYARGLQSTNTHHDMMVLRRCWGWLCRTLVPRERPSPGWF